MLKETIHPKSPKSLYRLKLLKYLSRSYGTSINHYYGVVKKTVLRQNTGIMCVNRPLHADTKFDVLYIVRYMSIDVNILGSAF